MSDHPGCAECGASRYFLSAQPPLLTRRGIRFLKSCSKTTKVQMRYTKEHLLLVMIVLGSAISFRCSATSREGPPVHSVTMKNANGMEVRAIDYGGIITSIRVPDREGHFDDVVLGYESEADYRKNNGPYLGAIIGRYGNRIAKGSFTLHGHTYSLAKNNSPNHLHGGTRGFDKVVWQAREFRNSEGAGVIFRYTSPDGEEGYPGTVSAQVSYTVNDRNELIVDYLATSDKPTPLNLTQHSYFNLAGPTRDILGHQLTL